MDFEYCDLHTVDEAYLIAPELEFSHNNSREFPKGVVVTRRKHSPRLVVYNTQATSVLVRWVASPCIVSFVCVPPDVISFVGTKRRPGVETNVG